MSVVGQGEGRSRQSSDKARIREQVWASLRAVARPDARFHWDFNEFIPDFEGSDDATERVVELPAYRESHLVFVTPDNGLTGLRARCIADRKDLLVSTHGIARGFYLVPAGSVPRDQVLFAATLDGLEYVGQPIGLRELADQGRIDVLVTGASAISVQGIRFGKGHGYFDLEWAIFRDLGLVDDATPIIAMGHDCQVVDVDLPASSLDSVVDHIVTPTRLLRPEPVGPRPKGVSWDDLEPGMLEAIPPLRELRELMNGPVLGGAGHRARPSGEKGSE